MSDELWPRCPPLCWSIIIESIRHRHKREIKPKRGRFNIPAKMEKLLFKNGWCWENAEKYAAIFIF